MLHLINMQHCLHILSHHCLLAVAVLQEFFSHLTEVIDWNIHLYTIDRLCGNDLIKLRNLKAHKCTSRSTWMWNKYEKVEAHMWNKYVFICNCTSLIYIYIYTQTHHQTHHTHIHICNCTSCHTENNCVCIIIFYLLYTRM